MIVQICHLNISKGRGGERKKRKGEEKFGEERRGEKFLKLNDPLVRETYK